MLSPGLGVSVADGLGVGLTDALGEVLGLEDGSTDVSLGLGLGLGLRVGEGDLVGSGLGVGSALCEEVGRGVSPAGGVTTSAGRTKR